jgi:pimeloyl-ACP methyl ester carboxylesterase
MLHGWPQHWYEWRYLLADLQDSYHLICPDLRGFGWSDIPDTGYEKEQLVDDILGILDELGIERVRLIGHDWGGWLGFLLCLRQPERVERFLALAILHPWQRLDLTLLRNSWRFGYQGLLSSPFLGARLVRQPELMRRLIRLDSADGEQWRERDMRWYTALLQDPVRARASVLLYRTFLLREMLPVLRGRYRTTRLGVPTHVLTGARDLTITPALLGGYEPYADAMTVEVVPNAGHFLPEECPTLVAEHVRSFFMEG